MTTLEGPLGRDSPEEPAWYVRTDHPFVGQAVVATTLDGEQVTGEIDAIWEYEGTPRRLDIDVETDDRLLNIDRERVEVA